MPESTSYPSSKLVIVGGGIIAYLEAYIAFIQARKELQTIRISIHEKNTRLNETTVVHLVPSLTPSEIIGVVNHSSFFQDIDTSFQHPGGILASDMRAVLGTEEVKRFIDGVRGVIQDKQKLQKNTELMLRMQGNRMSAQKISFSTFWA